MRQLALHPDTWRNICKLGQGKDCCRYLIAGGVGFQCAKLETEAKKILDERVAAGQMSAQSDNCKGVPMFEPVSDCCGESIDIIPFHEGDEEEGPIRELYCTKCKKICDIKEG